MSVLIEGKLHLEVKTALGRKWVERYVRILPGSIGYWSSSQRPGPGTPPRQLFLLDDLNFKVEGSSLCLIEATSGVIIRLRGPTREETKKWVSIVRQQKVGSPSRTKNRSKRKSEIQRRDKLNERSKQRSASVPPPLARPKINKLQTTDDLMISAAKNWDEFIAKQAHDAALRELENTADEKEEEIRQGSTSSVDVPTAEFDDDSFASLVEPGTEEEIRPRERENEKEFSRVEAHDETFSEQGQTTLPSTPNADSRICKEHDHTSASLADIDDADGERGLEDSFGSLLTANLIKMNSREISNDGPDEEEKKDLAFEERITYENELPADVADAALKLVEETQNNTLPPYRTQTSAYSEDDANVKEDHVVKSQEIQQEEHVQPPPPPSSSAKSNRPKSQKAKKKVLAFRKQELGFALELVRFESGNKLIVPRIRETCEYGNVLCPGDELVAVNGAAVPAHFPKEAFEPLLERLSAAPRPIRLSFRETMFTIHTKEYIENKGVSFQEETQETNHTKQEQQIYPLNKKDPGDKKLSEATKSATICTNQTKKIIPPPATSGSNGKEENNLNLRDDLSHMGTPGNHRQRKLRSFVPMVSADEALNSNENKNDCYFELAFCQPKLGIVLAREPMLGGAVVSKVRENCEHKNVLQPRDELISVDGVPVPQRLTDKHFEGLLKIIKASKRPITLKLKRPSRPTARNGDTCGDTSSSSLNQPTVEKEKSIKQQQHSPRHQPSQIENSQSSPEQDVKPRETSFFFSSKDYDTVVSSKTQRSQPEPQDIDSREASFFFSARDYEHLQASKEEIKKSKEPFVDDDSPEAYLDQTDVPPSQRAHSDHHTKSAEPSPNIPTAPAPVFSDDDDDDQATSFIATNEEEEEEAPTAPNVNIIESTRSSSLEHLHYHLFDMPAEKDSSAYNIKPPPISDEVENTWRQFIQNQAADNMVPDAFTP